MLKPKMKSDAMKGRVAFREALAEWFSENGRDYPWRRTREPYAILISEVMLQQTQIATVLGQGILHAVSGDISGRGVAGGGGGRALAEGVGGARLLSAGEDAAGNGAGGDRGAWRRVSRRNWRR